MDLLLLLLTMIITLSAQGYINSTYRKTNEIMSSKNKTGKEIARKILDENGLKNVKVNMVRGVLSDHYDPRTKTVNLSSDVYSNSSLAAVSVASHECGHAIQHKENYFFLTFRNSIVPIVNFASSAGYIIIMIGLFASIANFIRLGILFEFIILFFQIITLPVEFDASRRALYQLEKLNLVTKDENKKCRGMLRAAAYTYVASVASGVLEILRLIIIANRRDD